MNATELRIGNYIKQPNGVNTVFRISEGEDINTFPEEEIEPIPLSEEWLLRFGFEWDIFYQGYTDGNWVLNSNHESGFRIAYGKRRHDHIVWKIEYVHQLQNLYFALTGNELELTK